MREKWPQRIGSIVAPLCMGLILWACGLNILGGAADEPDDDTTTTGGDATTGDALSSNDGGATSDGNVTVGDALADADAAAVLDAPADSPTAANTFCTSVTPVPTFCADFDHPADASPTAGWNNNMALDAGASVTLSTTTPKSAPRSLHATSTQGNGAYVTKTFPMNSQLSVELDVRYATLPAAGAGVVSVIRLTPPAYPGMDVYFFANGGRSYFQEFGDDYSPNLASPSLNVWHHIVVTIVTNGTSSTINASIDGVSGWTNHTLMHPWPTPTTAIVQVGAASLYQLNNADVLVDNVIIRVQ